MVGRPATPFIIIVHTGEVIMNQRISVDELYRQRVGEDLGVGAAQGPSRKKAQCWPKALSTLGDRIPDGLIQLLDSWPPASGELIVAVHFSVNEPAALFELRI